MKTLYLILLSCFFCLTALAADGDTTVVRSHDKQHMKFPPSNRLYLNKVKFPDGTKSYRKIFLDYRLECPSTGCSDWDYDTHVAILEPTGLYDSTLTQHPYFRVDNNVPDSFYISVGPTYMTFYDTINMITDSVKSDTVLVEEFRNTGNPTQLTGSFTAYATGYYKYYFNASGAIIDSVYENGDSIWHQQYHNVYNVFEIKNVIEVGRLITPYGEPSGIDYYPYTYRFDITDYAPLLQDSTEVRLQFSGWQDGFLATLDFVFIEGTPPRDPKRVIHMTNGSFAYGKASDPINPKLIPYDLTLNPDEDYAQLNYTVTGHGADNFGCSEFCPKSYFVKTDGATKFTKLIWNEDCAENPIFPQGGTWIYDRANWCPGLPGYTDHHDLTPHLNSSSSTEISVEFQNHTTSGGSQPSYNINGHIITHGAINHSLDAEIEKIVAPNNELLQSRHNPICSSPLVKVRNIGSTTLTSLKFTYGVDGGSTHTYEWTGSLDFNESETVELPSPDWSRSSNNFTVSISEPNGGTDEYAANNSLSSEFDTPQIVPEEFVIFYLTNSRSSTENVLTITDQNGTEVYRRDQVANNQLYNDTVTLNPGCYAMKLTDLGEDGLSFFASSQGNGSLLFRELGSNKTIKAFQKDFGSELNFRFTVAWGLGTEDLAGEPELIVYPNPTNGLIYLESTGISPQFEVFDASGRSLVFKSNQIASERYSIDLSDRPAGIYYIRVVRQNDVSVNRIIRH